MKLMFSNTLCAAYLVEIVKSFEKYHGKGYLGRTAMQKLAYFCQATDVPIPCSFEIYNYGPYSDQVTFAVDSLLADEVICDSSNNPSVYSNYRISAHDVKFPPEFENRVRQSQKQIENVVHALGGFKPQQLELIATLHFLAARRRTIYGRTPSKEEVLNAFFGVKGNKFDKAEVGHWYDSLKRAELVA
ncbi:MAG: hypothetical protein ABSE82_14070 [Nitrososphaerales archaeon]